MMGKARGITPEKIQKGSKISNKAKKFIKRKEKVIII